MKKPNPNEGLAVAGGFKDRLFTAWLWAQQQYGGPIKKKELTDEINAILVTLGARKDDDPIRQSVMTEWFNGAIPREAETMVALAQALGVDPGWLHYGEYSRADGPPSILKKLEQTNQAVAGMEGAAAVDAAAKKDAG